MTWRTLIALLLSVSVGYAGQGMSPGPGVKGYAVGGFNCAGYLICQTFEGTGYSNSETWTEALNGGTANEDYTSVALEGSQSFYGINGTAQITTSTSPIFTAGSPRYFFFEYQTSNANSHEFIFSIRDASLNNLAWLELDANGKVILHHGTITGYDNGVGFGNNTTYYVWVDYTKGTGANGVLSVWISTTKTKPGVVSVQVTTGDSTADAAYARIYGDASGVENIYDVILVKTTAIGNIP